MMQIAQLVEIEKLSGEKLTSKGTPHFSTGNKSSVISSSNENKGNTTFSMRTITLRGVANGENKEGPIRRLSDAEF